MSAVRITLFYSTLLSAPWLARLNQVQLPCKKWCSNRENACAFVKCIGCDKCADAEQTVYRVPCLAEVVNNTLRIAIIDTFVSNSSSLHESLVLFAATEIQSKDCITISAQRYNLEFIAYGTGNLAAVAQQHVESAYLGLDARGNSVGPVDLIVTGTWRTWALDVAAKAEELEIPNIHTYLGNPRHWTAERRFSFGLSLPNTQYFNAPIRSAALRGLRRIAIITDLENEMETAIALNSLAFAEELGMTNIGPSVSWCQRWSNFTRTCRLVNGHCCCGQVTGNDGTGLQPKMMDQTRSFYEFDLTPFKSSGWVSFRVYPQLEEFLLGIVEDIRMQGADPQILCSLVATNTKWSLLSALWKASVSPEMLLFTREFNVEAFAENETSGSWDISALNATHGYSLLHSVQWHETIRTVDPVFNTGTQAVEMFKKRFGRKMVIKDACNALAGVIIQIASAKLTESLAGAPVRQRRSVFRLAISNLYDDTFFGTVRFNRDNQNSGREPTIVQNIPHEGAATYHVVLPERYANAVRQPFVSWGSRFGCPPGSRNTGIECRPCPHGTYSAEITAGMVVSHCRTCPSGMEPTANSSTGSFIEVGARACTVCPGGRYRTSSAYGLCVQCGAGTYRNLSMSGTSCGICSAGTYAEAPGATACDLCPPGRYRDSGERGDACSKCSSGRYHSEFGGTACIICPEGAECPVADVPYPKPGWYYIPPSFRKCETPGACLGGPDSKCADGMHGPFCNTCQPGWTRYSESLRCARCYDRAAHALVILLVLLAFGVYIVVLVKLTVSTSKKTLPSIALRIFLNYVQLSCIAVRVANFELPDRLARMLSALGGVTGDPTRRLMSLDCEGVGFQGRLYELKLAVVGHLVLPAAILLVVITQFLWSSARARSLKIQSSSRFVPAVIATCFVLHPMVTDIFVRAVDCVELDTWRLRTNTIVVCGSSDQSRARSIAIAGIFIWSFGLPLVLFISLFVNRFQLFVPKVRRMFGLLINGFRHEVYYFECVLMLRKVLVIVAAAFPLQRIEICRLILLFIGIFSLAIQSRSMPFDNRAYNVLNGLEVRNIEAFVMTLLGSLILHISAESDTSMTQSPWYYPVVTLVVLSHLIFFIYLAWACIRHTCEHRWVRRSLSDTMDESSEDARCGGICEKKQFARRFGIGELLVDKYGAVDLRALHASEREFLKTALNAVIGCIINNTTVFRMEQFNQLVIIAAARAAQGHKSARSQLDLNSIIIHHISGNARSMLEGLGEALVEARGAVRSMIQKRIEQIQRGSVVEDAQQRLLSEAAQEALAYCAADHTRRPCISVEELHSALVDTVSDILAGHLVLDKGLDLAAWTASVSQYVNKDGMNGSKSLARTLVVKGVSSTNVVGITSSPMTSIVPSATPGGVPVGEAIQPTCASGLEDKDDQHSLCDELPNGRACCDLADSHGGQLDGLPSAHDDEHSLCDELPHGRACCDLADSHGLPSAHDASAADEAPDLTEDKATEEWPKESAAVGFDGEWWTREVRVIIIHKMVMFDSGPVHRLEVLSEYSCVLYLDEEEFRGQMESDGMSITWNDGDIWTRALREAKSNESVPCQENTATTLPRGILSL